MQIDIEKLIQRTADSIFDNAIDIVEKHGVCYFRFTKEDGIIIIKPEYNQRINGIICDA